jgi:hypothetical protein
MKIIKISLSDNLILRDPNTPTSALKNYLKYPENMFLTPEKIEKILKHPNCTEKMKQEMLQQVGKQKRMQENLKKEEILYQNLKRQLNEEKQEEKKKALVRELTKELENKKTPYELKERYTVRELQKTLKRQTKLELWEKLKKRAERIIITRITGKYKYHYYSYYNRYYTENSILSFIKKHPQIWQSAIDNVSIIIKEIDRNKELPDWETRLSENKELLEEQDKIIQQLIGEMQKDKTIL